MNQFLLPQGHKRSWLYLLTWLGIARGLPWAEAEMSITNAVRLGIPIHTSELIATMTLPCVLLALLVVASLQESLTETNGAVIAPILCVLGLVLYRMAAFVGGDGARPASRAEHSSAVTEWARRTTGAPLFVFALAAQLLPWVVSQRKRRVFKSEALLGFVRFFNGEKAREPWKDWAMRTQRVESRVEKIGAKEAAQVRFNHTGAAANNTAPASKPAYTYLTTEELSERIKYSKIAIRNVLIDSVLIEGVHYFRPFGGRKLLFIWEVIEADMRRPPRFGFAPRPHANGGYTGAAALIDGGNDNERLPGGFERETEAFGHFRKA